MSVKNLPPKFCLEKDTFAADRSWWRLFLNQVMCILNWSEGSVQKVHAVFPNPFELRLGDKPGNWARISNIATCICFRSNDNKVLRKQQHKKKKCTSHTDKADKVTHSYYSMVYRQLLCILAYFFFFFFQELMLELQCYLDVIIPLPVYYYTIRNCVTLLSNNNISLHSILVDHTPAINK